MNDLKKVFDDVIANKIRAFPEKTRVIEQARKDGRLLAVRGGMDYVEKVLPHCYAAEKKVVDPAAKPPDIREFDVVFIGCPGHLNLTDWKEKLTEFVVDGGVLLTTDWCLENVVQKVFPQRIKWQGTAGGKYPLRVVTPAHPLLEGIGDIQDHLWVIEAGSYKIGVVDHKNVEVLLDAPKIGKPAAVLVAFPVGKGLVVHAISHFHLQGSDESGEYFSAYILTNVIDEAIRRKRPELMPARIRIVRSDDIPRPPRIRLLN
jgi:hypothetical protein